MRQGSGPAVLHYAAVVENLLELDGGFLALPIRQIGFPANVGGIETGEIGAGPHMLPDLGRDVPWQFAKAFLPRSRPAPPLSQPSWITAADVAARQETRVIDLCSAAGLIHL